jgi:hypothetical protein
MIDPVWIADRTGRGGAMGVSEIGDELYQLPPQAFTAARDGHVAAAKNAGDSAAAAELAAMRRPSMSAWLVNLLAIRRSEEVAQLIELGETMRAAQANVTPTQLRDLSAQRRREIGALVAKATVLVAEAGQSPPSKQHLTEVESTLAAAMADDESASLVLSGRVLKPLTYSGFGQAALPGGTTIAKDKTGTPVPGDDGPAWRAAAGARLDEARRILAGAVQAEREANDRVERLAGQIAELKDRLDAAQRDARAARQARVSAERETAAAERRVAHDGTR